MQGPRPLDRPTADQANRERSARDGMLVSIASALLTDYPDLAAEWDSTANGSPDGVLARGQRLCWWRCAQGHRWTATVVGRFNRSRSWQCPWCSGQIIPPAPGEAVPDVRPDLAHYVDVRRGVALSQLAVKSTFWVSLWCGTNRHEPEGGTVAFLMGRESPCRRCFGIKKRAKLVAAYAYGDRLIDVLPAGPDSAQERRLRNLLEAEGLALCPAGTAIKVQDFFGKPWARPDIVLSCSRVAIEYDSPGAPGAGLHQDARANADALKTQALAEVGWIVVRARMAPLEATSARDVVARRLTRSTAARVAKAAREAATSQGAC